jgi:hypothetical protein
MLQLHVTGDTPRLRALIAQLQKAPAQIPPLAAKTALPEIKKLVKEHFDTTTSPDEEKWAPLKKPTGLPPIRGLRDYFTYRQVQNRVSVSNLKWYTKFHHTGTRYMEARRFLLWDSISPKWKRRIAPALNKTIHRYFRSA